MQYFVRLATLAILSASAALAASTPPSGAITVGTGGKYSTLTAALADTSSSTFFVYGQPLIPASASLYPYCIFFLLAGTYTGQVYITRANIKIYGQTSTATSYTGNSESDY